MTRTDAATPYQTDADADAGVRVTSYELMTLFYVATTAQARQTREALRLPTVEADSDLLPAAMSSLVLRGLAEDREGRLVPVGTLVGLVNVLFTATRWLSIATRTEVRQRGALVVDSPHGGALMEELPGRIWQAVPLVVDADPSETAAGFVAASFAADVERPFGGVVTDMDAVSSRTAAVRVDADGSWTLARGRSGKLGEPSAVTPDETFGVLVEAAR